MVPWEDVDGEVRRYVRDPDPLPDLVGTWSYSRRHTRETEYREVVVTIGPGTLRITDERDDDRLFRLTATLGALDPVTLHLPLTDAIYDILDADGNVVEGPAPYTDGNRIGVAPSLHDNYLIMAPPWSDYYVLILTRLQ